MFADHSSSDGALARRERNLVPSLRAWRCADVARGRITDRNKPGVWGDFSLGCTLDCVTAVRVQSNPGATGKCSAPNVLQIRREVEPNHLRAATSFSSTHRATAVLSTQQLNSQPALRGSFPHFPPSLRRRASAARVRSPCVAAIALKGVRSPVRNGGMIPGVPRACHRRLLSAQRAADGLTTEQRKCHKERAESLTGDLASWLTCRLNKTVHS